MHPQFWHYLTSNDIIQMHAKAIGRYGGAAELRDAVALESCVAQPQTSVFGTDRFDDALSKAAAYCFFIVRLHPFMDGNKRAGLLASIDFLMRNGMLVDFDSERLYRATLDVASGESDLEDLIEFYRGFAGEAGGSAGS